VIRPLSRFSWVVVAILTAAACAPATAPGRSTSGEQGQPAGPAPNRTLVMSTKVEPTTLAPRALTSTGSSPTSPVMSIFSSWMTTVSGGNVPRAQLAEELPKLNTSSWVVNGDGTMTTGYTLRAGATWHDGTPITAQDAVFGWEVFSNPDLGVRMDNPIKLVADVTAPDERTVIVRWKQLFPDADTLGPEKNGGVPVLPRHLLEEKYRAGDMQRFLADSYWSTGFVGSGPYRLDRWELGAYIEASAFDGFVEGRPQIEKLKWVFVGDENAAVASLLSGDIHVAGVESISLEQASLLHRQWGTDGPGVVILAPNKARFVQIQFKDGYVNPRAILDQRVRRAFLEAADRLSLSEAIVDGQNAVADAIAGPNEEYFADVQRTVTKYPYNVDEAASLMAQAGFTKQADGFFADASGQRLSLELRNFPADPGPRENAILGNQWKNFGIDVNSYIIPNALAQDLEQVSAYPAFRIEQTGLSGTTPVVKLQTSSIATAAQRWAGNNRGGWANAEYDRYIDVFMSSLDRAERNRAVVQGFKVTTDELPVLPLYYLPLVATRPANLEGPVPGVNDELAWDNISKWKWTR
jgi:peptide/nickel transport system substrate-binding protein